MKPRYSSVFNFRLNLPRVIQFGAVAGVIAAGSTAQAVDYIKANNENNLNTTASWLDSAGNPATSFSPNGTGSTDLWTWDNRVTNANSGGDGVNNVRASDQGVRTIRILDPEVAVAISLDTATAGRTMTYTAGGGIDMANATQDLTFVNGFYRATGGVAASFNVKTGRKLEFLSAVTQNVRNSSTGGTVSMNTDGVSAGRIVIGGVFNPTNVIIGAGVVEFNSTTGTTRLGTSATTVNGGTLVVNNTSGSATGAGSVTIKNTATLTGQGIMTGLVTVESGATIIPTENAIGSLTAGSLTLAANTTIKWEGVDPAQADIINVTGNNGLTINGGTISLFNVGTTVPFSGTGTYNLFSYAGSIAGGGVAALTVAESSKLPNQEYTFGVSGGFVTLTIGVDQRPKASWNVDADGTWSTGSNWTGGVAPNASTFVATLGGVLGTPITAPRTVTLDAAHSVGTLIFDSAQSFTVAGTEILTFDNGTSAGSLSVENGSHSISAPLSLPSDGILASLNNAGSTLTLGGVIQGNGITSGISKSGPGTLILTADNGYAGPTSIGAGLLQIGAGGTTGSVAGTISNNGTLRFSRSNALLLSFGNEISGTGGVDFAGSGTTTLEAANTYSGPTTISAGAIEIGHELALQNSTLTYSTTGGTLTIVDPLAAVTLGALAGDRPFPLTNSLGGSVALTVGQNNASTSYTASTIGTGTSFTKAGSGTFSVSGTHAFTGNAAISGGVLGLDVNSDFSAAAFNTTGAGSKLLVNGGTLTASASSQFTNASSGLDVVAGTASFNGGIISENNVASGNFFTRVTGGILNAASLSVSRGNLSITTEPTSGQTGNGLYINGGAVNITGSVLLGNNANSSVSARLDSGSLAVGGPLTVGIDNTGRWSVLDIGGGTFTSTDAGTGVRIGTAFNGQAIMLVRGGVATAERIQFGQPDFTGKGILNQTGGSLYVGAGGMVVGSASPSFTAQLRLGGGLLGATADSTSNVPVSLTGPTVVTGADSLNVPHTVSFSGNVTGTGSLTKNGSGSVNFSSQGNAFSGPVTVNTGTLGLGGQSGAVSVATTGSLIAIGTLNAPPSSIDGTLAVRYDADALVYPGRIQSSGTLTLGAASVLDITGTGTLTAPVYFLASGSSISGAFASVTGTVPGGYSLVTNFNGGTAIALVSNTASAYDLWASSFGLSGPQAAADFDADSDGLDNLIEFGQGSNPTQFSTGPVLGRDGNFLTLTFNHIAGGGITFVIESNDDLAGPWDVVQTYPTFGAAGTQVFTDNVAIGTGNTRFLRLSVIDN